MSTAANAIKTGLFTLFVPLVVAVWIPRRMLRGTPSTVGAPVFLRLLGGLLVVLGTIGYFWCATLFVQAQGTPAPISPTKRAVVGGLYRVNRNPMYSSVLAVVFGQALFFQSARVAWYGLLLVLCFHVFVVFYEERVLRAQFGSEYKDFYRRVPRWVPRFSRCTRRPER